MQEVKDTFYKITEVIEDPVLDQKIKENLCYRLFLNSVREKIKEKMLEQKGIKDFLLKKDMTSEECEILIGEKRATLVFKMGSEFGISYSFDELLEI